MAVQEIHSLFSGRNITYKASKYITCEELLENIGKCKKEVFHTKK